jgi:SAM-dependent methyltransferase
VPIDYSTKIGRNSEIPQGFLRRKITDRMNDLSKIISDGARVLEVGCAEGDLGKAIKEGFSVEYTGIEPSLDASVAKAHLDKVFPSTKSIELKTNTYDFILSFHTIEHIENINEEIGLWKKILSPHGIVVIECPNGSGHPNFDVDRNVEHIHSFTPSSLALLLESHGFEIVKLTVGHFESPAYPDSLRLVARHSLTPEERLGRLQKRFSSIPTPIALYGIGGDFCSYIEPYVSLFEVKAYLDKNRIDRVINGRLVRPENYSYQIHSTYNILITSMRFEGVIFGELLSHGHPEEKVFFLSRVLEI